MYQREIISNLKKWMDAPEILILFGARQVGKSTLLEMLSSQMNNFKILNCENPLVSDILQSMDLARIRALFDNQEIVAFDEAQSIPDIGKILKFLFDENKGHNKFIATGSSSFDLANKTGEPLTGRNLKFRLYPLSLNEINMKKGWLNVLGLLKELLVYGSYPGIIDLPADKKNKKLIDLTGDYLFKDIYKFEQLRSPEMLRKLLQALALQVGNLVSVSELSNLTCVSAITVERYLDLLEKSFVIFKLGSYSTNLRNELKKSRKYYFYDNGIRNAIINNFVPIDGRTDAGALWENFCISEYMKYLENQGIYSNLYFWRTYDGTEIDLVEERGGKLFAFEFKWDKKAHLPKSFAANYPVSKFQFINRENLHLFLEN